MADTNSLLGIDFSSARAQEIIAAVLRLYGITDPDAIAQVYNVGKESGEDAAYLALRETKAYKAAFPGMEKRKENKLAAISEQTYMEWRDMYKTVMRNNGIPENFYDSEDDFTNFIGNNISPGEIQDRVMKGVVAARNAPPEVKDALLNFYGIDEGHLAAYWLDPTPGRGEALLREQAATYVGAAATRAKFAGLTRQEAEGLVNTGKPVEQVEENLSDLVQGEQLLSALPGEVLATMTREEQLAYAGGNPAVTADLKKRAAQRKAQFAGGGEFATSSEGVTGLGSSQK